MKKIYLGAFASSLMLAGCLSNGENGVVDLSNGEYPKNPDANIVIKNGYYKDIRDNNEYKVVKIGNRYWFAENLRFADSSKVASLKNNIWCLNNDKTNCEKYGVLYSWSAAMDIDSSFNSTIRTYFYDEVYQGICPDGWRIPDSDDWEDLKYYVEVQNGEEIDGTSLKSLDSWLSVDSVPHATNRFGFNALANGRRNAEGGFLEDKKFAYFWTSDQIDSILAKGYTLRYDKSPMDHGEYYKEHGMAVRCVQESYNNVSLEGGLDSSYIKEIPHDYGKMTIGDQEYKTVKIGDKVWMAENANYDVGENRCYNDEKSSCEKYGRLYEWQSAQKVCPAGWAMPSVADYSKLKSSYAGNGTFLRSLEDWKNEDGLNFWGFNALPAGGYNDGSFFDKSLSAYFWTNSYDYSEPSMGIALYINYNNTVELKKFENKNFYSVRCVKE